MLRAERVGEAGVQERPEARALLVREPRVAAVAFGVLEVDLLVSNVEIAAGHNWFLLGQPAQEPTIGAVPLEPLVEPRELVLRVRGVDVHEPVAVELERAHAALVVGAGAADLPHDLQRLLSREDRRPRVALALGVAPRLRVAGQVELELPLLELGLLQREDVGVEGAENVGKARVLLYDGAQAVHVPRNKPLLAGIVAHGWAFLLGGKIAGRRRGLDAARAPAHQLTRW